MVTVTVAPFVMPSPCIAEGHNYTHMAHVSITSPMHLALFALLSHKLSTRRPQYIYEYAYYAIQCRCQGRSSHLQSVKYVRCFILVLQLLPLVNRFSPTNISTGS